MMNISNWISNPENQARTLVGACLTTAVNSYFGPLSWVGYGAASLGGQWIAHQGDRIPSLGNFCGRCVRTVVFSCKLRGGLERWCDEKLGEEEYQSRVEAAQRIEKCYTLGEVVLDLNDLGLTTLPPEIGRLVNLEWLSLLYNQLTALPSEIGRLVNLQKLNLSRNQLTALPLDVFSLDRDCGIILEGCPFSHEVLQRIRDTVTAQDYQGPRIHYSTQERDEEALNTPLPELLDQLYGFCDKEQPSLDGLAGNEHLQPWLSKLSWIGDFKNGGEQKMNLAIKITEYLELAEKDLKFRESFSKIIDDASTTCGDRMALSVIRLGIAKRLATIDFTQINRDKTVLVDLLIHGCWILDQLEKIAREKVATQRFIDEVEVHLGYLIPQVSTFTEEQKERIRTLRESLRIPLDVEEMLYFRCSDLSYRDLKDAYTSVLNHLNDSKKRCEYLAQNDYWRRALQQIVPEEYENALQGDRPIEVLAEITEGVTGSQQEEYKVPQG